MKRLIIILMSLSLWLQDIRLDPQLLIAKPKPNPKVAAGKEIETDLHSIAVAAVVTTSFEQIEVKRKHDVDPTEHESRVSSLLVDHFPYRSKHGDGFTRSRVVRADQCVQRLHASEDEGSQAYFGVEDDKVWLVLHAVAVAGEVETNDSAEHSEALHCTMDLEPQRVAEHWLEPRHQDAKWHQDSERKSHQNTVSLVPRSRVKDGRRIDRRCSPSHGEDTRGSVVVV